MGRKPSDPEALLSLMPAAKQRRGEPEARFVLKGEELAEQVQPLAVCPEVRLVARGDTTAALASLRTSLAGNPNYAPTWRGLGLVFEKMGDKVQARAAFKRYLQLAPTAGDAEQIRGRLEWLGS